MVSVIVAAYNGEKFILEQIQSIYQQTIPADEVIICDDCSKDSTVAIVQNFIDTHGLANWRLIRNASNQGFNRNFFHALAEAHGDIIFLSDQDDVWLPNKIEVMAGLMQADPEMMALSCAYSIIDGQGCPTSSEHVINAVEIDDNALIPVTVDDSIICSFIRGCAMCIRKEVKAYCSSQYLSNILGHDWILNIVASLIGKNYILHKKLFLYRYHGNNTSLSAVTRSDLIGEVSARIKALEFSIKAHEQLLAEVDSYPNMTPRNRKSISRVIAFEKNRVRFLSHKNPFVWLTLILSLQQYKRYYKSAKGALKVYIGDLCYAYGINFKIR